MRLKFLKQLLNAVQLLGDNCNVKLKSPESDINLAKEELLENERNQPPRTRRCVLVSLGFTMGGDSKFDFKASTSVP